MANYQKEIEKLCKDKSKNQGAKNNVGYILYLFIDDKLSEQVVEKCLKGVHGNYKLCFYIGYEPSQGRLYYAKGLEKICYIMGYHYLRQVPGTVDQLFFK